MNTMMDLMTYAVLAVFAQNLIFTSGVGAERSLRIQRSFRRISVSALAVMAFSWVSMTGMFFIQQLSEQFPVLLEIRALLIVLLLAVVYLVVMAVAMYSKKYKMEMLVDTLPSAVFNSIVMMAGIVQSMYGMSYMRLTGYAIGTGIGYFLATVLIQEAIDNIGGPDMPEAFAGLPSLLLYIGILAVAFTGFNGGPSVFL
ncbi:MAG: hypothetical protein IJY28_06515 [Clostridia bacterium]|nr:hypothetical protein [Clostridia bacterium]